MPLKERDIMSEKIRFISRILDGESISSVSKEFGIHRKTGEKYFKRFKNEGIEGLTEKSRAPITKPNKTPRNVVKTILEIKDRYRSWGAPKIREKLIKNYPLLKAPAVSTIHHILDQNNLVTKRKRKRYKAEGTPIEDSIAPNDLWCVDFKGQFKMKNNQYCYPLTMNDHFSRFIIGCEAMEQIDQDDCINSFEYAFEEYGLPNRIRSDNGVPFSSRNQFGLSKLSIWWLRLGIKIERIRPGNPQENGRLERMHRTLKRETAKPPMRNLLQQQERFDHFKTVFNEERPHEGLKMKTPSEVYRPSSRVYSRGLSEIIYDNCDVVLKVTQCGSIYATKKRRVYIGVPFAGQDLGVKKIDENLYEVYFMHYKIGYFDDMNYILSPIGDFYVDRMESMLPE